MGTLTMTVEEREAFLAELHVGVISIGREGRAPLTVPIWYGYEPGGTVNVVISPTSLKARAINEAGRFSLCAQTESAPYKYVTVEGPVTSTDDPVDPEERRALAHRYLGPEVGELYLQATEAESADSVTIRMTPERWLTTDYAKQFG